MLNWNNIYPEYFTSRFMYYLNTYAIKLKKYYCNNKAILEKEIKLLYSELLQFERVIGKIIIFPSFLLIKKSLFSGRKYAKEKYNKHKIFSVIMFITNNYENKNWISNAIDITSKDSYKGEKEILFLPFSFFLVKDIKIDTKNYTADIYLETIGKTEILEEEIKKGKQIIYNEKEKIMEVQK